MIRIRLRQPGQPDVTRTIPGNVATIGRDAACDVPINQPFVSKQHCRIFKGLIVVDLGSRNGTFVDGVRIKDQQPTNLRDGRFELSKDKLEVTVLETDEGELEVLDVTIDASAPRAPNSARSSSAPPPVPAKPVAEPGLLASLRGELERERQRAHEIEAELTMLRARASRSDAGADARQRELEQENLDLRRRLETLRTGVEESAQAKGDEPLAKLLQEQVEALRAQNEDLRRRVAERDSAPAALAGEAGSPLASAPSALFASLQNQVRELRAKLANFESGAAPAGNAPIELFGRLQSENQRLRRRVAELEAGTAGVGVDASLTSPEIEDLRAKLAVAEEENRRLRGEAGPRAARASSPSPGVNAGTYAVLRRLVEDKVNDEVPSLELSGEDFVVLESLRCLRRLEAFSTGLASEALDLYERRTMVPGVQGNLRTLASAVLADADRKSARGELRRYLDRVERWIHSSEISWRRAARDLVLSLKQEFSAEGLTAGRPIPALANIPLRRESELWKRSCEHWSKVAAEPSGNRDAVMERLEELWRESVEKLVESGGARK